MIRATGDWRELAQRENTLTVDFHWNKFGPRTVAHGDVMGEVYSTALDGLIRAYNEGYDYVLFTHGNSTSGPGKTTSRSIVRQLIRSKESTPYILRNECIQHETVLLARIREKPC